MTGKYQTIAEINATFNGEWVLIADPTHKRQSLEVSGGVVVIHSADRRKFWKLCEEWNRGGVTHTASFYAGEFPEEVDEVIPVELELIRQ